MVGDLPLAMLVSPDGRWAIVTNNGYAKPTLTIVDLKSLVGSPEDADPRCLARPGVASGRETRLRFGRRGRVRSRVSLGARQAGAGENVRDRQAGQGRISGRPRDPSGWPPALRRRRSRQARFDARSGLGRGFENGGPAGGTLFVSRLRGRRDAARLALGRREDPPASMRPRSSRGARFPSASIPMRWSSPRTGSGSSSRAPTRTRCGRSTSLPGRPASRSRSRLTPDAPPGARRTPWRFRRTAGRCSSPTPTTMRSPSWTSRGRPRAGSPVSFRRRYPTGVRFTPDGRRILVLSGKGLTSMPNPRGPQPGERATRRSTSAPC